MTRIDVFFFCRRKICEEKESLGTIIRESLSLLKDQKESLATLALQWDDFDQKTKAFNNSLSAANHKFATIDSAFRSLPQMMDIKHGVKVSWSLKDTIRGLVLELCIFLCFPPETP